MSLTFKCWGSNAVALVFLKLLMIPEIAITLNEISACIAYKSVTYKRHVMISCKFFVCLFCISFGQYFQINRGFGKNIKRELDHIGNGEGVSKLLRTMNK